MDIFDLVDNEKFFNPLGRQNRKIYYECIITLIENSKEVPVLYDYSEAFDGQCGGIKKRIAGFKG